MIFPDLFKSIANFDLYLFVAANSAGVTAGSYGLSKVYKALTEIAELVSKSYP